MPMLFCGYYICRGTIYCRFDDARPLLKALRQTYPSPKLALDDRYIADFGTEDDYCLGCGLFQQETKLELPHLTTNISLTLAFQKGLQRHISSFPNTLEWIMHQQNKSGQFVSWHNVVRCSCRQRSAKRSRLWSSSRA